MQDRAKAGLKLAVGSAAIYSLTCWRTPVGRPTGVPLKQHTDQKETLMTKLVLALALAFATLATVPASAGPYCQEDLGYGRTSSFGCGG